MLSFLVFAKFKSRRQPLFSSIGRVPTVSESPFPVSSPAHVTPSRHTHARDEKQFLLSSSKTRPYKSLSRRDARKSFRIRSYTKCRVSPGSAARTAALVAIPANLHLYFQPLARCFSFNPFLFKLLHCCPGCTPSLLPYIVPSPLFPVVHSTYLIRTRIRP